MVTSRSLAPVSPRVLFSRKQHIRLAIKHQFACSSHKQLLSTRSPSFSTERRRREERRVEGREREGGENETGVLKKGE